MWRKEAMTPNSRDVVCDREAVLSFRSHGRATYLLSCDLQKRDASRQTKRCPLRPIVNSRLILPTLPTKTEIMLES